MIINYQESLSTLFSLYIRDAAFGEDNADARWIGRQGIALALHAAADVLRTKDLPVVMTFLISRALVSIFYFAVLQINNCLRSLLIGFLEMDLIMGHWDGKFEPMDMGGIIFFFFQPMVVNTQAHLERTGKSLKY